MSVDRNGKVTLYGTDGSLDGESQCTGNGFDYTRAVSLLNRFQSAVERHDVAAVVALIDLPMRWGGKPINDAAALRDQFDTIFDVKAVKAIEAPDPRGLFCRSDGFMMGDGVVWGRVDAAGAYRVQALNTTT